MHLGRHRYAGTPLTFRESSTCRSSIAQNFSRTHLQSRIFPTRTYHLDVNSLSIHINKRVASRSFRVTLVLGLELGPRSSSRHGSLCVTAYSDGDITPLEMLQVHILLLRC